MLALVPRGLLLLLAALVLSAAPARAQEPLFGFNSALGVLNLPASMPADRMAAVGATSVRSAIHWSWVEPERDIYRWEKVDAMYRESLARGIRPLLQVFGSPSWTWGKSRQTCALFPQCNFPPARTSDKEWQELFRTMAARYPQAAAIEVWNEPNLAWAWEGPPDAARYTELLRLAYDAVKSVAPSMKVLGGALAPVVSDNVNSQGAGVRPFLQAMYDGGARGRMDAISVHPYPYDVDFAHSFKTLSLVKETRTANGDAVPLWLTEFGLTTTGPEAFTEAQQAVVLPALLSAFRGDAEVDAIYVHTLIEPAGDATGAGPGMGVLRRGDLSPKPAYCSLAAANGRDAGCAVLSANASQSANWEGQTLLQAAADAARTVHQAEGRYLDVTSADLHAVDARISPVAPPGDLQPGAEADPSVIGVYPVRDGSGDGIVLCNATRATRSHCIYTFWRGRWTYGTAVGGVYAAAGATVNGGSSTW